MSNPPNRKRKRAQILEDESAPQFLSPRTSLLSGMTFVVSTRQPPKSEDDDQCHLPHPYSYKYLTKRCRALGATVTAQVHRQVSGVLATPAALADPPTQRVRQAGQRGIPVVAVQWLFDVAEKQQKGSLQQILPWTDYLCVSSPQRSVSTTEMKENGAKAPSFVVEKVLDLQCCCVCHEDGRLDCEWCVDCNVNTAGVPPTTDATE